MLTWSRCSDDFDGRSAEFDVEQRTLTEHIKGRWQRAREPQKFTQHVVTDTFPLAGQRAASFGEFGASNGDTGDDDDSRHLQQWILNPTTGLTFLA